MYIQKERLNELTEAEVIELAEQVLHHTILVARTVALKMLPSNQLSAGRQTLYVKILVNLTDSIHNLPTYIKQGNLKGLRFELSMGLDCFRDYFLTHQILISELYARSLLDAYSQKGVIKEGE